MEDEYGPIKRDFSIIFKRELEMNKGKNELIEIKLKGHTFVTGEHIHKSIRDLENVLKKVVQENKWEVNELKVVEWNGIDQSITVYCEIKI